MATNGQSSILITGAGRRIGRALAIDLASHGWAVGVHFHSSEDDAKEVVVEISAKGGTAEALQADLTNERETANLIAKATETLGPLDGLINNASVFEPDTPETADRVSWDSHMEVNLRAPFVLSQAFAAQLPATASGTIINVVDQRVWSPGPGFISYTLSKMALWDQTRLLARALAPRVRVNAIGPGPTLPSRRQTDAAFSRQWQTTPLERRVELEDICQTVRYILGASAMTGQMIAVDSGQHLGPATEQTSTVIEE